MDEEEKAQLNVRDDNSVENSAESKNIEFGPGTNSNHNNIGTALPNSSHGDHKRAGNKT